MADSNQIYFSRHIICDDLTRLIRENLPREKNFGHLTDYPKGDYVLRQGDEGNSIFFLQSGQVAVKNIDAKGHEIIIRLIGEGEPFGELCLCTEGNGERRTSACAVIPSEVIEVSVDDFINFLQQNHESLKNLLFTFCVRLAEAEHRIEVLAYRGAEERLGKLLLSLASTQGEKENNGTPDDITLAVSHEDLAQMAAMSRAHTTVTMGTWYSLQDHVDWDIQLREIRDKVNQNGLYNLERKPNPVAQAFKDLCQRYGSLPIVESFSIGGTVGAIPSEMLTSDEAA